MVDTKVLFEPESCFSADGYRRFMLEQWPAYLRALRTQDRMVIVREYARRIPVYLVARCPFCQEPVGEPVDTFSLNGFGWASPGDGRGWAASIDAPASHVLRCPHVRIVAYFLSLRGSIPDDLFLDKRIVAGPEVPSLMLVPMTANDSRAVIYELPVGRFDDEEPQPHYSAFFISYFTESRESFIEAIRGWGLHHGTVEYRKVDYDLQAWAERGRVLWLDPGSPELPLRKWGEGEFPYGDIQGDRNPYRNITRKGVAGPEPRGLARLLRWKWKKG